MSDRIGGWAFPHFVTSRYDETEKHNGMTLRDYFAGQALMGLLSSNVFGDKETFAKHSYEMADAMLAERLK